MPTPLNKIKKLPITIYSRFIQKIIAFCFKMGHEVPGVAKMNDELKMQSIDTQEVPVLTVEDVKQALEASAKNAAEMNDQLRDVFSLSDSSATLRLR